MSIITVVTGDTIIVDESTTILSIKPKITAQRTQLLASTMDTQLLNATMNTQLLVTTMDATADYCASMQTNIY